MADSIAFDRAANFYDETRAFPPGEEAAAVAMLARAGGLTPQHRVLEFGVGTGRIALPLLPHVGRLVGLDLARPMMERLRAKGTDARIGLAEADATRMPFAAHSFDAALSVHVLHLIANWRAVLGEVARILQPGAPYIHAWSDNFHNANWWNIWNEVTPKKIAHGVGVTFNKHHSVLDESGWQPLGEGEVYTYTYHKSPRTFLDQLRRRVWSSTWDMTDEQLNTGIIAVETALQRDHGDLDAPVEQMTSFHARAYLPPAI